MEKTNVFTFWEGTKPAYIDLCMNTWKFPYTLLTYQNVESYTDLSINTLQHSGLSLPQIADVIRVHVLRDNGGYWMDTDTIMVGNKLPEETIMGYPRTRENTIGFLHTEKGSEMFTEWARFQDEILQSGSIPNNWDVVGNAFTDDYLRRHPEIKIYPIELCWPETYMVQDHFPRRQKYLKFYFEDNYQLKNLWPTDFLMLHNSWTPGWYRSASKEEVLSRRCTLSNILKEVTNG